MAVNAERLRRRRMLRDEKKRSLAADLELEAGGRGNSEEAMRGSADRRQWHFWAEVMRACSVSRRPGGGADCRKWPIEEQRKTGELAAGAERGARACGGDLPGQAAKDRAKGLLEQGGGVGGARAIACV